MQSSRQLPSSNDFNAGKMLAGLALLGVVGFLLIQGFLLLRDGNLPKLANAAVAIVWGVGGVAALSWWRAWPRRRAWQSNPLSSSVPPR